MVVPMADYSAADLVHYWAYHSAAYSVHSLDTKMDTAMAQMTVVAMDRQTASS